MALGSGGSLGTLTLYIKADTTNLDNAIAAAEQKIRNYGSDFSAVSQELILEPTVNDKALTELNKHLDLKEKHFKKVGALFQKSPLKPKVDLSDLEKLSSQLKELDSVKSVSDKLKSTVLKPTVDTSDLEKLQSELKSSAVIANTAFHVDPKVNTKNLDQMRRQIVELRNSAKQLNATEVGFKSTKPPLQNKKTNTTTSSTVEPIGDSRKTTKSTTVIRSENAPITLSVTPKNLMGAVRDAGGSTTPSRSDPGILNALSGTRSLRSLGSSLVKMQTGNDNSGFAFSTNTKINPYVNALLKTPPARGSSESSEMRIANQAIKQSLQKNIMQVGKFTINQAQIQIRQALTQPASKKIAATATVSAGAENNDDVITAKQVIGRGLEATEGNSSRVKTEAPEIDRKADTPVDMAGGFAERTLQMVIQQAFTGFNPASILISLLGVGIAKDVGQGIVSVITSKLGGVFDLVASQTIGVLSNTLAQYANPMGLAFAILVPGLTALAGVLGGVVLKGTAVGTVFDAMTKAAGFGLENASKIPGAIGGVFKVQDTVAKTFGKVAGEEISKSQKGSGGILGFFQKTAGNIFRGLTENIGARISSGLIKGVESQFGFKLQDVVANAVRKGIQEGAKAFQVVKQAVISNNPFGARRMRGFSPAGVLPFDIEEQMRSVGRNVNRTARRAARGARKWARSQGNTNTNGTGGTSPNPLRQSLDEGIGEVGNLFSLDPITSVFSGAFSGIKSAIDSLTGAMSEFFKSIQTNISNLAKELFGLEDAYEPLKVGDGLPKGVGVEEDEDTSQRRYSWKSKSGQEVKVILTGSEDGSESEVSFKVDGSFANSSGKMSQSERDAIALRVFKVLKQDAKTRPDGYKYKGAAYTRDGYGAARAEAYQKLGNFTRPIEGVPGQLQFARTMRGKIQPDTQRLAKAEKGFNPSEIDEEVARMREQSKKERATRGKNKNKINPLRQSLDAGIAGIGDLFSPDGLTGILNQTSQALERSIDWLFEQVSGFFGSLSEASIAAGQQLNPDTVQQRARVSQKNTNSLSKQQQKNFGAFVSASAKTSRVGLAGKKIPKLVLDDKMLSQAGAKAMYNIKDNTVVISNAIAKLLEKAPEELEGFADEYAEEIQHLIHEIRHAFQFDFGKLNYADIAKGAKPGAMTSFGKTSAKAQNYAKAAVGSDYYQNFAKQMPSGFLDVVKNTEADAVDFESRWKEVIANITQELQGLDDVEIGKTNRQSGIPSAQPVAFRFGMAGGTNRQANQNPVVQDFVRQLGNAQKELNKIISNPKLQANFGRLQSEAGNLSQEIGDLVDDIAAGTVPLADLPDRFADVFKQIQTVTAQAAQVPSNLQRPLTMREKIGNAAKSFDQNQLGSFFNPNRATQQLNTEGIDFSAESFKKLITSEEAAFAALQGAVTGDWSSLFEEFYGEIDRFLDQAADSIIDFVAKIPGLAPFAQFLRGAKQFKAVAMSFVGLQLAFKGYQEVAQIFEGIEATFIQAALAAEKYERTLSFVLGSQKKASEQIARLQEEASNFGLDAGQTISGYSQIAASSKETSLEGTGAQQISSALNQASGVYSLSGEEQGRVNTAIAQMISKNTVSAEELRQQLGEVLPGSFNIAARAAGKTTAEFNQMLESGQVLAADFLPKFAQQLSAETASGVVGAMNSSQAATNRFTSELQKFQVMMGKGLIPERNIGLGILTKGLELLQKHALTVANIMGTLMFRQIFRLLGAFAVFGSNLVKASFNLAGFLKGLAAVQAFMATMTRMLLKFAGQFIVFTLFFDMVQMLQKAWGDASGGLDNFVKTSKKGMEDYKKAVAEAREENKNFNSSLPKKREDVRGESLLEGTFVGGILGKKGARGFENLLVDSLNNGAITGAPIKMLTGGKGLRRYADKKLEDTGIAADEIMSGSNDSISQMLSYRGTKKGGSTLELRKVQDIDKKLRDVQTERRGLSRRDPGNIGGIKDLQKQESELLKEREKNFKPLGSLQAKIQGEIDGMKEALKKYDELAAEGGVDQETYKTKTDSLKESLKAAEKQQIEFNRSIGGAADSFTYLQRSLEGVVDKLAGADAKIKAIGNSARRALSQGQARGEITTGEAQFTQGKIEEASLQAQVNERKAAVTEIQSILSQLNAEKVLEANGITDINQVSGQELNTLADRSKDSPQDAEVFKRLAEVKQVEIEIDDMQTQIEERREQTAQQIRDANKQIGDYFRDIGRQSAELALTTKEAQAQIALQQQKNKLKSALQGFQDNFFSSFVDSLIEGMDSLNEPLSASIEKEREIQQANFSAQDRNRQTADLYKSLPLDTQKIKIDFSAIDSAPVKQLQTSLQESAKASKSVTDASKQTGAAISDSAGDAKDLQGAVKDVGNETEGVRSATENVGSALQDTTSKAQDVNSQLQTNKDTIDTNRVATEEVGAAIDSQVAKTGEAITATANSEAATKLLQQAWAYVTTGVADTAAKTWEWFQGLGKNIPFLNQFGEMIAGWGKNIQDLIGKTWEWLQGLGKNIPFLHQIGQTISGWGQNLQQLGQQAGDMAGNVMQQGGNMFNQGVGAVQGMLGMGKGVGKIGSFKILESVGGSIQNVNSYKDLEKHHPSAGRERGRSYGNVAGEFEEIRNTRDGRTLVKKDFILVDQKGSQAAAIPAMAEGFVKVLNDATNTVQIYADKEMRTLIGQSLHMRNIAVKTGDFVRYGQKIGTQSDKGSPGAIHAHIELEAERFTKYIADLRTGNFAGVTGKEQAHSLGDGHNHFGEEDAKKANQKVAATARTGTSGVASATQGMLAGMGTAPAAKVQQKQASAGGILWGKAGQYAPSDLSGLTERGRKAMEALKDPKVRAFLDAVAVAELGDQAAAKGGYGYRYGDVSGKESFNPNTLQQHPEQFVSKWGYKSNATGRYQVVQHRDAKVWDEEKGRMGLRDFKPQSQELIAVSRMMYRGILDDVQRGDIKGALNKPGNFDASSEWASIQGNPYGQGTSGGKVSAFLSNYQKFLGQAPSSGQAVQQNFSNSTSQAQVAQVAQQQMPTLAPVPFASMSGGSGVQSYSSTSVDTKPLQAAQSKSDEMRRVQEKNALDKERARVEQSKVDGEQRQRQRLEQLRQSLRETEGDRVQSNRQFRDLGLDIGEQTPEREAQRRKIGVGDTYDDLEKDVQEKIRKATAGREQASATLKKLSSGEFTPQPGQNVAKDIEAAKSAISTADKYLGDLKKIQGELKTQRESRIRFEEEQSAREAKLRKQQEAFATEEINISVLEAEAERLKGMQGRGIRDQGVENLPKLEATIAARREEISLKQKLSEIDENARKSGTDPKVVGEQKKGLQERLEIVKKTIAENQKYAEQIAGRENAKIDRENRNAQIQQEVELQKQLLSKLEQIAQVNPNAEGVDQIPKLREEIALKELDLKLTNDIAALDEERFGNKINSGQYDERLAAIQKTNAAEKENLALQRQQAETQASIARRRETFEFKSQGAELQGQVSEALAKNIELGRSKGDPTAMRFATQKQQQELSFERQMLELDELESSGKRTKEEIDGLRKAYTQLNEISLENLRAEQQRATEDKFMEISGRFSQSRGAVLSGKADMLSGMGLDTQAKEYRKAGAIADQGQSYAQQSLELERFIQQMGLSSEKALELRANLSEVNNLNLQKISQEFSVMGELMNGVQSSFESAFTSILDGSKSIGEAALDFIKSIGSQLASMASKMITDQLFGKIMGKGNEKDAAKEAGLISKGGILGQMTGGADNPLGQYSMMNPLPVTMTNVGALSGMGAGAGLGDWGGFGIGGQGNGSILDTLWDSGNPLAVNIAKADTDIFSSLTNGLTGLFSGGGSGGGLMGGIMGLAGSLFNGGGGGASGGGGMGGLLGFGMNMLMGGFAQGGFIGDPAHIQAYARGGSVGGCGCSACRYARGGMVKGGHSETNTKIADGLKRESAMTGRRSKLIIASEGEFIVPNKVASRLTQNEQNYLLGKAPATGSLPSYARGGFIGDAAGSNISSNVTNLGGSTSIGGATVNVNGDSGGQMTPQEAKAMQAMIDAAVVNQVSKMKRPRGLLAR